LVIRNRPVEPARIEKRGYIWQCAIGADDEKYIADREAKKQPCGYWNPYFGTKWATRKGQPRWQAYCGNPDCRRKRQLNTGNVFPEPPNYYQTKADAIRAAEVRNFNQNRDNEPTERFL